MKKIDLIQTFLIIISVGLLMYSLIYLVNYYSYNNILIHFPENYNTEKQLLNPNEIGDSIGGTLNPIIAFTASILTFLAFYIQFKANKEQREIFNNSILKEKNIEKNNHITNIKIFKILVLSMISYYKETGVLLKKFIEEESQKPLQMNTFSFVTNSSYTNLNKLDLKDIFASIKYSFEDKSYDWEKEFIDTLTTIDFYEKLIEELRKKYQIHSEKKIDNLNAVGDVLNRNIGEILSDDYLSTFEGVDDYIAIVYNRDKFNKPIVDDDKFEGVDLEKLHNTFFKKFLDRLKKEYDKEKDEKFKVLLEKYSLENKNIGAEKFQTKHYVDSLQFKYSEYFENEKQFTRINTFLENINIS